MKNIFLSVILSAFVAFVAIGQTEQSYGAKITRDNAVSVAKFKEDIKGKDSLRVKLEAPIIEACKVKGCWMNVDLGNGQTMMVRFKDYGFFMPLNSKDEEVIVNGKAFLAIESVAEQKHYAKDAGKSQAAIDSITTPIKTYSFLADGVLIKNNEK
jgi:hypothetical protein